MKIVIFGKRHFVSQKGSDCYILYYGIENPQVEGYESRQTFCNQELFNKVSVNKIYVPVWGINYDGKARLEDVQ